MTRFQNLIIIVGPLKNQACCEAKSDLQDWLDEERAAYESGRDMDRDPPQQDDDDPPTEAVPSSEA